SPQDLPSLPTRRSSDLLDAAQDNQEFPTPALRALSQVHGARRFYQREQPTYQERPDERPNGPDDGTTGDTPTGPQVPEQDFHQRSEEHTSELQSRENLV